jgi:hypothetical protein
VGSPWAEKKSYWEGVGAWFSKFNSMLQDLVDNKKRDEAPNGR